MVWGIEFCRTLLKLPILNLNVLVRLDHSRPLNKGSGDSEARIDNRATK